MNAEEKARKFNEGLRNGKYSRGQGCLFDVRDLHKESRGMGEVYWVERVGGAIVCHYYFVPQGAQDLDMALNQRDNGFSQYPAFTIGEVRMVGSKVDELPTGIDFIL